MAVWDGIEMGIGNGILVTSWYTVGGTNKRTR